ncbi:MAG: hypothetical protein R3Y24_00230 [Eubacteriales bacterium]
MEKNENEAVAMFDTLYTTNHLQIMKIILPYLEADLQKKLAIYIKFQEMKYTMNFFKEHSISGCDRLFCKKDFDMNHMLHDMAPYFTEKERNLASQYSNIKNMMDSMEQFAPIIKMFQASGGMGDNMDFLKGMLSPEQVDMFEMFQQFDF